MALKLVDWVGRTLCRGGTKLLRRSGLRGVWIDVGAHHGETTLWHARQNPSLRVYAVEPNLTAASKLMGRASNYFVLPMAIAEHDGLADLHLNSFDAASSLLPMDEAVRRAWVGGEILKEESVVTIPTVRLDTLMRVLGIGAVDFLKVDTQGTDLAVIKSAGKRLADIAKITVEVSLTPAPLYSGAAAKEEVIEFLGKSGFSLVDVEEQSHGQEQNLTFVRKDR